MAEQQHIKNVETFLGKSQWLDVDKGASRKSNDIKRSENVS
jgi:hypothetical protein